MTEKRSLARAPGAHLTEKRTLAAPPGRTSRKGALWLGRHLQNASLREAPHQKAHSGGSGARRVRLSVTSNPQNALFRRVRLSSPGQTRRRLTEKRILAPAGHGKAHSACDPSRKSAVCPTDGLWNVLFRKMAKQVSGLGFLPQSQRTTQRRGTHLCIPSPPLYYARINLALYHTCDFSYASPVPERHHPLGTWAAPDARKSQGEQAREERNLPP